MQKDSAFLLMEKRDLFYFCIEKNFSIEHLFIAFRKHSSYTMNRSQKRLPLLNFYLSEEQGIRSVYYYSYDCLKG